MCRPTAFPTTRGQRRRGARRPGEPVGLELLLGTGTGARVASTVSNRWASSTASSTAIRPPRSVCFGGYFYNLLDPVAAVRRALRAPGGRRSTARSSTRPARTSRRTSKLTGTMSPCKTEKVTGVMGWVVTTDSFPEAELQKREAKAIRDSRPDLAAQTDAQLLARAFSLQRHLRVQFSSVVWASMGSSVAPGILPALLGEVEPEAIAKLMSGLGDVDRQASPPRSSTCRGWCEIGRARRRVRRRARRAARARRQVGIPRCQAISSPPSTRSCTTTAVVAPTSGTSTNRATRRSRRCCSRRSSVTHRPTTTPTPRFATAEAAAERRRLIDKYEDAFADESGSARRVPHRGARRQPSGCRRASGSSRATSAATTRCGCASTSSAAGWPSAATSHHPRQIYMLLADEVDDFLADPAVLHGTARRARARLPVALPARTAVHRQRGRTAAASNGKRRGEGDVTPVQVGDVLKGVAGSPGEATGTARIMLDLSATLGAASPATS